MSIDKAFDEYLAERNLTRRAEVVPDHACQVFEPDDRAALADAEELVRQAFLGDASSTRPRSTGTAPTTRT